jgi:hypothetical protein
MYRNALNSCLCLGICSRSLSGSKCFATILTPERNLKDGACPDGEKCCVRSVVVNPLWICLGKWISSVLHCQPPFVSIANRAPFDLSRASSAATCGSAGSGPRHRSST